MNINMNTIILSSNGSQFVINKDIVANTVDVNEINVSDDIYVNNNPYMPVGSIVTYSGITSPNGWLICDGSEVSQTSYPRLFSVIGNLYGTPINNSNFVLPNLGDRVPIGKSNITSIGNLGGNSSITLSVSQLPSHTHTGTTVSSGIHTHTGTTDISGTHNHTINDPGHTHTQWTINDDFNNSGGNPPGFAGDSAGYSTWSNINSSTTGISVNSSGNHAHTFTTENSESHNHTFTSDSTGSGSTIDIRNKFIVLNYIIRY